MKIVTVYFRPSFSEVTPHVKRRNKNHYVNFYYVLSGAAVITFVFANDGRFPTQRKILEQC